MINVFKRQGKTCRFFLFTIYGVRSGFDLPRNEGNQQWGRKTSTMAGRLMLLQKVRKEKLVLHKLKVKPKDGGTAIFLDKKELRGVRGLVLNMGVNSIPTVYLEMNVALIDVEVNEAYVIHEEKIKD